jgi:putative oxidoreductase
MFPNHLPGAGLLLLRLACGIFVVAGSLTAIPRESYISTQILQSVEFVAALLLILGLWTPVAGTLIVLVQLFLAFSEKSNIENCVLLAAIGAALAVMGPGAHSIDARRYGRKRIDIGK